MSWCEANPFTAGRELRERFSGMPGAFTWTKLGPGAAKSDATTQASAGFLSLSQQCSKSLERWDLSKPTRRSPSTFRPSSLFQANVVLIEDKASGTQLIQELIVEGCGAVTKYTPECEKIIAAACADRVDREWLRLPPGNRPLARRSYQRVREAGVITSQAVLIAIGIDWDGRRQVLAVELANRESRSSWRDFLLGLKARGLHGVEFVVADDHAGLRAALRRFWRRRPISAATCISCGTRSTTCHAGSTTTACRSCAGCTTGATSARRAAIWRPGSPSGQANTQSSPAVLPAAAAAP